MSVGTWRKKLRTLVQGRHDTDLQISKFEEVRTGFNKQILGLMQKHQKDKIKFGELEAVVVQPQKSTLDEKGILRWYKRHGKKPPVKKVFDVEAFERDVLDKVFPAKMLRTLSDVEDKEPYIRINVQK